jgi:hypothetical protein
MTVVRKEKDSKVDLGPLFVVLYLFYREIKAAGILGMVSGT